MNNEQSENEIDLKQELNTETLHTYLERRFPELEPASSEGDLSTTLRALQGSGRKTLDDVQVLLDEHAGTVAGVISDMGGTASLATSIVRISLFSATSNPDELTTYYTAGSSIDRLVGAIQRYRGQSVDSGTENEGLNKKLDVETLRAYIQHRFPDRELAIMKFDYSGAVQTLQAAMISTVKDVDSLLNEHDDLINSIESDVGRMNVHDIIRYSLVASPRPVSPGPFVGGGTTIGGLEKRIHHHREQFVAQNAGRA